MAQTMTPSNPMTLKQVDKAVAHYRALLMTHRTAIGDSAAVQAVLGQNRYLGEQIGVLRKHIAMTVGSIVHTVRTIDRSRSNEQVLIDTGRKIYSDSAVVATMPRGTKSSARLHIFNVDKSKYKDGVLSCNDLAEEYRQRGLRVDVEALADYCKKNPAAADEKGLACQWIDADGKYCFAAFYRWPDARRVYVSRGGLDWHDDWSFAGVPEVSSTL